MGAVFFVSLAHGQSIDDLKKSIDDKTQEIRRLEEEAQKYRGRIAESQAQAKNLQGELTRIDRTLGALRRDIGVTRASIAKKELEIILAQQEISQKESVVIRMRVGLGAILQSVSESDQNSLVELVAQTHQLSHFFGQMQDASFLEDKILESVSMLRNLQDQLEEQKSRALVKKEQLQDLGATLRDRTKIEQEQRVVRAELLQKTKSQEKQYQALLREQEVKRAALEEEISRIEEKIKVSVDTSILPRRGSGVLTWPLANISLGVCRTSITQDASTNCITQFFGYTSFAAIGGYNGKGHNGVDFRADVGTPVLSGQSGEVTAVGDTDVGCRGASYGKWILIRYPNNLSTLYAHLSAVSVSAGAQVERGERVGYSGKTGYATGPHLHMSVFATQGVQVQDIRSRVCGRMMTLPVASINSYLNPLDYL